MKNPTSCVLWNAPELVYEKNQLQHIRTYVDESHLWRYLLKCHECGQLYFFEFYEEINWDKVGDGNDYQYSTWIPVSTEQEAESLKDRRSTELLLCSPRLQADLTPVKRTSPHWIVM